MWTGASAARFLLGGALAAGAVLPQGACKSKDEPAGADAGAASAATEDVTTPPVDFDPIKVGEETTITDADIVDAPVVKLRLGTGMPEYTDAMVGEAIFSVGGPIAAFEGKIGPSSAVFMVRGAAVPEQQRGYRLVDLDSGETLQFGGDADVFASAGFVMGPTQASRDLPKEAKRHILRHGDGAEVEFGAPRGVEQVVQVHAGRNQAWVFRQVAPNRRTFALWSDLRRPMPEPTQEFPFANPRQMGFIRPLGGTTADVPLLVEAAEEPSRCRAVELSTDAVRCYATHVSSSTGGWRLVRGEGEPDYAWNVRTREKQRLGLSGSCRFAKGDYTDPPQPRAVISCESGQTLIWSPDKVVRVLASPGTFGAKEASLGRRFHALEPDDASATGDARSYLDVVTLRVVQVPNTLEVDSWSFGEKGTARDERSIYRLALDQAEPSAEPVAPRMCQNLVDETRPVLHWVDPWLGQACEIHDDAWLFDLRGKKRYRFAQGQRSVTPTDDGLHVVTTRGRATGLDQSRWMPYEVRVYRLPPR